MGDLPVLLGIILFLAGLHFLSRRFERPSLPTSGTTPRARRRRLVFRVSALLVLLSLVGAGATYAIRISSPEKRFSRHLDRAAAYIEKNQLDAAVIELKHALSINSDYPRAHFTLGLIYLRRGELGAAQATLERVHALDPVHEGNAEELGRLYLRTGQAQRAVDFSRSIERRDPLQAHLLAAQALLLKGDLDGAERSLASALRVNSKSNLAYRLRGDLNVLRRRPEQALRDYEQAISLNREDWQTHYAMGRLLYQRGEREKAARAISTAVGLNRGFPLASYDLAHLYVRAGEPEKAVGVLRDFAVAGARAGNPQIRAALRETPQQPSQPKDDRRPQRGVEADRLARLELARIYQAMNMPVEAERTYRQLQIADPKDMAARMELIQTALARGEFKKVLSEGEQALQAVQEKAPVYIIMALAWMGLGEREKAREAFEQALREDPKSPIPVMNLSSFYQTTGEPEKAIAFLRQQLKTHPAKQEIRTHLANLYLVLRRHDEAIREYEEAIKQDPNLELPYARLGLIFHQLGKADKAVEYYERALALNPNDPVINNNLAFHLASQRQQMDRALVLARRAANAAPGDAGILDTLGWVYFQTGAYDQAVEVYKEILKLKRVPILVLYHLGLAYHRMGRKAEAISALKEFLKVGRQLPEAAEAVSILSSLGASP
jgi:tetratricopeptide (TPR) repeat protein